MRIACCWTYCYDWNEKTSKFHFVLWV
jgi:hypothetical protein